MQPDKFFAQFGPPAVESYETTGLFASTTLAQLVQELGWDVKTPVDINTGRDSLNLFNIKGEGPAGSVTCWTREYVNGQWVSVQDDFRAYNSYAEAFEDHAQLLLTRPWYECVRLATTPKAMAQALYDGGYATDPNYAGALTVSTFGAPVGSGSMLTEASRTVAPWYPTKEAADAAIAYLVQAGRPVASPQSSIIDSFNLTRWDDEADFKKVAVASLMKRFGILNTAHDPEVATPFWLVAVLLYRALVFLLKVLGK